MIVHQNGLCYSNKKYHKGGIRVKKLLLKNAVMLAVVIFCIGSVNCYAATSTGINVNYHSQKTNDENHDGTWNVSIFYGNDRSLSSDDAV